MFGCLPTATNRLLHINVVVDVFERRFIRQRLDQALNFFLGPSHEDHLTALDATDILIDVDPGKVGRQSRLGIPVMHTAHVCNRACSVISTAFSAFDTGQFSFA